MKKLKHAIVIVALVVSSLAPSLPARADDPSDFMLVFYFFAWTLANPPGAAVLALDANLWQFLIDSSVPFMSPYAPALRTLALTKAPTLKPKASPPKVAAKTIANSYSQVISFGDSMSDNGNMLKVTSDLTGWGLPMAPNNNGRFCNGPVILEVMSNILNRSLLNYAFGGGQSGYTGLVPVFALQIGVLNQVDDFIGSLGFLRPADPKALYVIWTGPDDYYQSIFMYFPSVTDSITANVKRAMTKLYQRGARQFFVPLMPDLSITPAANLHNQYQTNYLTAASQRSNELATSMSAMLKSFAKQYPLAKVRSFDTLTYSQNQYALAVRNGINVTTPCYQPPFMGLPGPVCDSPGKYLFWDENHPTAEANLAFGEAFANAAVSAPLPTR